MLRPPPFVPKASPPPPRRPALRRPEARARSPQLPALRRPEAKARSPQLPAQPVQVWVRPVPRPRGRGHSLTKPRPPGFPPPGWVRPRGRSRSRSARPRPSVAPRRLSPPATAEEEARLIEDIEIEKAWSSESEAPAEDRKEKEPMPVVAPGVDHEIQASPSGTQHTRCA